MMNLKEIKSTGKIPFIPLEHSKYITEMILVLKMWLLSKSTHKIPSIPLENSLKYNRNDPTYSLFYHESSI